jgi:anti-sigma regulatory factor (Ser/Thr protein kinase)
VTLDHPSDLLSVLSSVPRFVLSLDHCRVFQVWGLVGVAALCRQNGAAPCEVVFGTNAVSSFALALGVQDVIQKLEPRPAPQPDRTVRLRRFLRHDEVETVASDISRLILQGRDEEGTRRTVYYVLVELLRNVVQHSQDRDGGVVAAQMMTAAQKYSHEAVQVAVCDTGIGVLRALQGTHPDLTTAEVALERARWPHSSGAFEEGQTGGSQNAGRGLFFISEMAKATGGRLLLASRGAALFLQGDDVDVSKHTLDFVKPAGAGFPGTLVSFELPLGRVPDHEALLQRIRDLARARVPARAVHRWLRFVDRAPVDVEVFDATIAVEDTESAARMAREVLIPRLTSRKPVALDFQRVAIGTQSYLHALLYEPLRVAWALKVPVYVLFAQPAVRSGLEHLEAYALGG